MMLRIPSPQSSPASGRGGNRENQSRNHDYAPKLRAKQQQADDEAAIRELEQRAAPLLWMTYLVAAAIALGMSGDFLHGHVEHYIELAAQQEALVQCLNGKFVGIGDDAMMRCSVYQLSANLAEVQP